MAWEETNGNYNEIPSPLTELTEEEGLKELRSFLFFQSPKAVEYRQIPFPNDQFSSVRIFWANDGTGLMIREHMHIGMDFWHIGCQHDYKELSVEESRKEGQTHWGMCWHVMKCQNCDHIVNYDSSD